MRLHRIPASLTCLVLALAACTDDTQDDAADEIGTESESESASESGESESESSGSETTDITDTDTTEDTGTSETTSEESTSEGSTSEGSTSEGSTSEGSTSEESTSEESTSEESSSDTGFEGCQDIESTYVSVVENNTGCDADADCHVVDGHCGMGLGGCWYVVNQNLQQSDLDDLFDAFQGMACPPLVICACLPPPAVGVCIDGTCQPP